MVKIVVTGNGRSTSQVTSENIEFLFLAHFKA